MGSSDMIAETIATSMMLAMLAAAVVTDLRTGKIRNWLTAPCAAAGLALGAVAGGLPGVVHRALAGAVVLGALILLSRMARLGGGDIKLLVAVGALKGLPFAVWAMLLTGVFGGALAVMMMMRRRAVRQTAVSMLANVLSSAGGVPTDLAAGSPMGTIPYSVAIALGSVTALMLSM
jgi:prepilin peptidase CpaA